VSAKWMAASRLAAAGDWGEVVLSKLRIDSPQERRRVAVS
jgi:hypothetical protein